MKRTGGKQPEDKGFQYISERLRIWKPQPGMHGEGGGQEQGAAEEDPAASLTAGEAPGWGQQARRSGMTWRFACETTGRPSPLPRLHVQQQFLPLSPYRPLFEPQVLKPLNLFLTPSSEGACWELRWRIRDGMRVSEQGKVFGVFFPCFVFHRFIK